ncbi:hypothetical protein KC19_12G166900 [Ceratodon purpureus]|uniref:Uncharacterized protein n=1 Tax=Ceratodon purpureus TaxID=3225 RepID=A0A8T0G7X5_CERPU|nr:hypothetical protein KC19_12G166900 [Ceratodon purpureus]
MEIGRVIALSSKWMAMLEVCMEIGSTIVIYFIWKFSFDRVQNQLFVICILSTTCDVLALEEIHQREF